MSTEICAGVYEGYKERFFVNICELKWKWKGKNATV